MLNLFFAAFFVCNFIASIYSISVVNDEGKILSMGSFKDKVLVIALVDPNNSDSALLERLSTLQKENKTMQVFIVPATDIPSPNSRDRVKEWHKRLNGELVFLEHSSLSIQTRKKGSLVDWLSSVEQNGHFQIDSLESNSVFVVSRDGDLRSVLGRGFPEKSLTDALK
jgi:glutathione peroxidase-family protein